MLSNLPLRRQLLFLVTLASGSVCAHGFLVSGSLQGSPQSPMPGEPFTLRLSLQAPGGTPVEDAKVLAEFRPEGAAADSQPVVAQFTEVNAGIYQAQVELSQPGAWSLLLRDQTYEKEEARARLTYYVGRAGNEERISFILPPTDTGPASPWVWLVWLVVVPLLAGLTVTLMTLNSARTTKQKGSS